jgi:capsular polysaccharide export protein
MSLPLRRTEIREGNQPVGLGDCAEIMPADLLWIPASLADRVPALGVFSADAFADIVRSEGWDTPELLARAEACLRRVAMPGDNPRRQRAFAAACLLATRYTDPYTGNDCSFEEALSVASDLRRTADVMRGIAVCLGMSFWKRRRMQDILTAGGRTPLFRRTAKAAVAAAVKRGGAIAVWAAREPIDLVPLAAAAGVQIIHIEDGFVRSVGLGADFMPAASVVLDRTGIYFDPSRPSGLDKILLDTEFGVEEIDRARRLIRMMVERGITKYNVGSALPKIAALPGRRVIFVPGQVENDRSVALGGAGIYRNLDLLKRVRVLNSDAFILYKPHPDVDAGHRPGALPDEEVLAVADQVIRGISSAGIISAVDEVHTLTSLAGFEALIRNRYVVTYGQPFYAGWGLTRDFAPVQHRQKSLSLEQLVAGALILYPSYFDPVMRLPCGPEVVIDRLSRPEVWRPGLLITLRRLQGEFMRFVQKRRPSVATNSR